MTSTHWQDAVIRQLEIIGEATKRLSQDLRSHLHEIPCRRIAALCQVSPTTVTILKEILLGACRRADSQRSAEP
jgi:hypothetical protein